MIYEKNLDSSSASLLWHSQNTCYKPPVRGIQLTWGAPLRWSWWLCSFSLQSPLTCPTTCFPLLSPPPSSQNLREILLTQIFYHCTIFLQFAPSKFFYNILFKKLLSTNLDLVFHRGNRNAKPPTQWIVMNQPVVPSIRFCVCSICG